MTKCQYCKKNIDSEKLMLHEMYCERNCIKCDRCGNLYDQNDPESHEEEFHTFQQCPNCKLSFQDLKNHICQEVPILCQFCQLEIPIQSFQLHKVQCGSRTELCESCHQYVKMSEFSKHQQICQDNKFDKFRINEKSHDFPSIQEINKVPQVPKTYDSQIKQKQDQSQQTSVKFQTQQPLEFPVNLNKPDKPTGFQSYLYDNIGDQKKEFYTDQNYRNNYSFNDHNKIFAPKSISSINQQQQFVDSKYNQPIQFQQGLRFTQDTQEQNNYFYQEDQAQLNNRFPFNQQLAQESKYTYEQTYLGNQKSNPIYTQNTNNVQEHFNDYDQNLKLMDQQYNEFKPQSYPHYIPQLPEKFQQNLQQFNEINNYDIKQQDRNYQNEYQKLTKPQQAQQSQYEHKQSNFFDNHSQYYDQPISNGFESQQKHQNFDQFKQNSYVSSIPNYQQSKLNDFKEISSNQIFNNNDQVQNDSVIAANLQEQLLVEDLQMTEQQIIEQKQLYKMMEEQVKQQKNRINYPRQNYQETNQYSQFVQPNEFDFMTDEEKLIQRQLLERIELQNKRK
ncbi:unnamed protein product [Paramecium sonneborni]|uniref:TRAF-type domain-containing protein n=1 Tax=Paramecium sonneborni TaxID=65129 RepID=A0A8S1P730_9CILI|nr:unnamed protein product [Paramecium sonneborni]